MKRGGVTVSAEMLPGPAGVRKVQLRYAEEQEQDRPGDGPGRTSVVASC